MRPPFDDVEDLKTTPDVREQNPGLGRLLVSWDGGHRVVPLPAAGRLTVGRSVECEVRIDHASVSRKHAIVHLGHPLRVQDLGSSNGTRIGGRRLDANATAPLSPGEVVEIGPALLVVQPGPELRAPAAAAQNAAPDAAPPGAPRPIPAGVVVADPAMERIYREASMAGMDVFLAAPRAQSEN